MHCDATACVALIRRSTNSSTNNGGIHQIRVDWATRAVKRPTARVTERRTRPARCRGLGRIRRSSWLFVDRAPSSIAPPGPGYAMSRAAHPQPRSPSSSIYKWRQWDHLKEERRRTEVETQGRASVADLYE